MRQRQIKRQGLYVYIFTRVEFAIAVALFNEFDYETKLRSDFDIPDNWNITKTQILAIRPTWKEIADPTKFDLCFETMKFAKEFRMSPQDIANRIKPYIEESCPYIDRVDVVGGYMNIFFKRAEFFMDSI
jgi:hypothetical protein